MLTKFDDYPIHQTSEPIAVVATTDRHAYDRYWFNGYQDRMKSSFRNDLGQPDTRYSSFGFRVVLGAPLNR